MKDMYTKPPLGLRPGHIVIANRIREIHDAMLRYVETEFVIPTDWIEEYDQLVECDSSAND